jgi:alpha-L-fucosidase
MYLQDNAAYQDHLKNWGHPSEVGYKEVIEAWKADKFDAAYWVRLFREAGAKYIVTMAVHHDNFDMWDSKHQPKWNSLHYGPRKDVCGEIRAEALKAGLRWGVSTHLARSYSWFQTNKGADREGPKRGVTYNGNNPDNQDLYHPLPDFSLLGDASDQLRHPLKSPESWKKHWKQRMFDLIDRYHPDHFYFDGALPFMDDSGKTGLEVIAYYYNHNVHRHGGTNEGVMVIKNITRHGFFYPGISSVVMERRGSKDIEPGPKETENSIGPWFHTGETSKYRSSRSLLHEMIDTVSKNNNFLLNIPPKGDGSFDQETQKILKGFGGWFKENGEAIYGTRPWHTYGEENIRFTVRGKTLYAIVLNKPEANITIKSILNWQAKDVVKIELLGGGDVLWKLTGQGLEIYCSNYSDKLAYAFKITCSKEVATLPFKRSVAIPAKEKTNR